jgi:type II secretory ATPase GspE/PulE/Tfp pilus assembly ATPase PilB-like protein
MKSPLLEIVTRLGYEPIQAIDECITDAMAQHRSPIDALLDTQWLNEESLLKEISKEYQYPWVSPEAERVESQDITQWFRAGLALRHRVLPLSLEEKDGKTRMAVATYDPYNYIGILLCEQECSYEVEWHMTTRVHVMSSLRNLYGVGADTFEKLIEGRDGQDTHSQDQEDETNIIDQDEDEEASVIKFVNQIIREALDQRATDIHVEPLASQLRIRYRIDGRLIEISVPDKIKSLQSSVIARLKIMAKLNIAERRIPQDGRIHLQFEGESIDVRVATVPTVEGESISLRLLNQEKFNLDKLQMEPEMREKIETLLKLPNGIILITGPTGSGKSTSLYSFLNEVNDPERRIVTVEDPVENKLTGVMQIAIKPEIGLTFASALRSILRADPNIVMVGEVRDLETAEIAIRASLTGHLVFSTLHTNDAIGGINRLVDMGVEPFLVSAAVRAFIAQRLVRRLCSKCKTPKALSYADQHTLQISDTGNQTIYTPKGCTACRGTGYSGRLALYELVIIQSEMQELISQRSPAYELHQQAVQDGFISMREYGFRKVLNGETSIEEVIAATTASPSYQSKNLIP